MNGVNHKQAAGIGAGKRSSDAASRWLVAAKRGSVKALPEGELKDVLTDRRRQLLDELLQAREQIQQFEPEVARTIKRNTSVTPI